MGVKIIWKCILVCLITTQTYAAGGHHAPAFDCGNALRALTDFSREGVDMSPPKSNVMNQLYGPDVADKVYDRLQELDRDFNDEVQRVAYDHYWTRPGLSIKDKSLVTVVSLISLRKEEQTRIHMNGYLNSGGTVEELRSSLIYLSAFAGKEAALNGFAALKDVVAQRNRQEWVSDIAADIDAYLRTGSATGFRHSLSVRDETFIALVAEVALGDLPKMRVAMKTFLHQGGTIKEIKNALIHQIVYCGFPTSMNGFAVLKEIIREEHVGK